MATDSRRWKCLNKFITFGKRHLDYPISEFVEYYNTTRSNIVCDHLLPVRELPDEIETIKHDQIKVQSYVGGWVKSFERRVA